MKNHSVFSLALLLLAIRPGILNAQWSNDPAVNTAVTDVNGIMSTPHVAMTGTGDSYISWYSATQGFRFDVYLQLLGVEGNKQWEEGGLPVSTHPTFTFVTDYGLAVDNQGHAILSFQDKRDDVSNAFAYRISPEGIFDWGEDGVRLTDDPDYDWWPQVAVTDDNDFIFLYAIEPEDTTLSWKVGFRKWNESGSPVWDETILTGPQQDYYMPQMLLTEQGNLIVSWLVKTSLPDTVPGQANYFHVYLQKYDHDGQPVWPEPVQADTGNLMSYNSVYTVPFLANNGADGAYVAWQSLFLENPTIRVNEIGAGGEIMWQQNGIQVETNAEQQSITPSILYDPAYDRLYVFYLLYEYSSGLDCWAVAGQKFSPAGDRLWGDQPKLMAPFICSMDTIYSAAFVRNAPDERVCLFFERVNESIVGADTINQSDLFASLIDADGNQLWPDDHVLISNAMGYKGFFTAGDYSEGQWVAAWADNRKHPLQYAHFNIYAQNVTLDGTLGPLLVDEPVSAHASSLICYPNPCADKVTLTCEIGSGNEAILKMTDTRGRKVMAHSVTNPVNGQFIYEINTSSFSPGFYVLELITCDEVRQAKILKL